MKQRSSMVKYKQIIMKKILIYAGLLISLLGSSCKKLLEEEPKAILDPKFLKTEKGLNAGLDGAYAGMRFMFGTQNLFALTVVGTDEFQKGNDGNDQSYRYGSGYTPTNGIVKGIWQDAYRYLNAANGVIKYAPEVTMDAKKKARILAEAKFLRAQYLFILVQFWADITLQTDFLDAPTTSAKRDPVPAVYAQVIKDLREAIPDLAPGPATTGVDKGRATAAAASHLLAKVYLAKAGSVAKEIPGDYEQAYQLAKGIIDNRAALGLALQQDFKDVHREGNESNSEILWAVQHTSTLPFNGPGNSGGSDNVLNHMFVPIYDQMGCARSMEYGRPYNRCIPTRWLTDTLFKDKVNDTRLVKSFQFVWLANSLDPSVLDKNKWPNPLPAGAPPGAVAGAPKTKNIGDTVIYMPGVDKTKAEIDRTPYQLIPPRLYNQKMSPAMTKYFDTKRGNFNNPSIRPVIVYRLAETYLIAAEAAYFTSRTPEAVGYINALRTRAAYPAGDPSKIQVTAADISTNFVDFILDERSKELMGENMRWFDLARTGKFIERVNLHNKDLVGIMLPKHVIRPIPQDQINSVTTGDPYRSDIYFPNWN